MYSRERVDQSRFVNGRRAFDERARAAVVIDAEDRDFEELTEPIRAAGVKVLPIELLERPSALLDKARPGAR